MQINFLRIDVNEEPEIVVDQYETEQEVIDDAMEYYTNHWDEYTEGDLNDLPEDKRSNWYDENFKIETFEQALDFWAANDYQICRVLPVNSHVTVEPEISVTEFVEVVT